MKMEKLAPSAARLTESLRDIGYDSPTAIADLVDNSIAAGATEISIDFEFEGLDSAVVVADNGHGMSGYDLNEALRFGSRREYGPNALGRFGLGLKTASLSQCRRLTVLSRKTPPITARVVQRTLDLDRIAEHDEWFIAEEPEDSRVRRLLKHFEGVDSSGTVVILSKLDRMMNEKTADSGVGRRRLRTVSAKVAEHLAVVFHRYLDGTAQSLAAQGRKAVTITVDGEKLVGWDPFARSNELTQTLPAKSLELTHGGSTYEVGLQRFVLPARNEFRTQEEFDALSGPMKWNRQQGLYFYRADRIVQFGGWSGLRGLDEHMKLARAAIDFPTELDEAFQINVAKMRINLPHQIRTMLEKPVQELCVMASDRYRRAGSSTRPTGASKTSGNADLGDVGAAIRIAALRAGKLEEVEVALDMLKSVDPAVYKALAI